jgi:hypothetical protein
LSVLFCRKTRLLRKALPLRRQRPRATESQIVIGAISETDNLSALSTHITIANFDVNTMGVSACA